MSRVPSLAPTSQTVRPLVTAARRLALTGRSCSNCGSYDIRPSQSRNALDILLACLFLAPFRCRDCRERFYRLGRPSLFRVPNPPVAPLLIMPARRIALDTDAILPRLIEPETLPPPRTPPRLLPPGRKAGPVRPAFIERLEAGMRSPEPLPNMPPGAILILESDLSIRKLLRRMLERRGYSTLEVAEGDDVASELKGCLIDMVVIDISDAGRTGMERAVAIARDHPGVKVLALSSGALHENPIPGRLLTLLKPFPLEQFMDCVDRLLKR